MNYEIGMRKRKSIDYLPKDKFSLILWYFIVLYIVQKFPLLSKFHYYKDIIRRIEHLIKLDDIRMIDKSQDLDLTLHLTFSNKYLGNHIFILHLSLVQYLDGHSQSTQVVARL